MAERGLLRTHLRLVVAYLKVIRSCGSGTSSFRALFQILQNQRYIETLYCVHYPFFGHFLVIVMRDDTPAFLSRVVGLQQTAPVTLSLLCLRRREVPYLYIPDRFAVQGSYLYWYLKQSALVYGQHITPIAKPCVSPRESIDFTIEQLLQYARSHVILSCLATHKHIGLIRKLDERLTMLVSELLIAEGVPPLTATHLTASDIDRVADPTLRRLVDQWLRIRHECARKRAVSRNAAFQSAWVFENILRVLRGIVSNEKWR
jgi:hypothetical protein